MPLVTITARATEGLRTLLLDHHARPDQGVKLSRCCCCGRLLMRVSEPNEGDHVIFGEMRPLLIVDRPIARLVDGTIVDCEDVVAGGSWGLRFTIGAYKPRV